MPEEPEAVGEAGLDGLEAVCPVEAEQAALERDWQEAGRSEMEGGRHPGEASSPRAWWQAGWSNRRLGRSLQPGQWPGQPWLLAVLDWRRQKKQQTGCSGPTWSQSTPNPVFT